MPAGAPTKYKKEYNKQVYKLCLLGATNQELADFFEVHVNTIKNWYKSESEFLSAVKRGKEKADADVAKSLLKRAKGYRYKEITRENKQGYGKPVVTKVVTKQVAPDTGAAMAWLKNRQPDKWRDKHDLELSGKVEVVESPRDEIASRINSIASRSTEETNTCRV